MRDRNVTLMLEFLRSLRASVDALERQLLAGGCPHPAEDLEDVSVFGAPRRWICRQCGAEVMEKE